MKNIPYYTPEICDGHFCPKDCEAHCPWADEAMEFIAEQEETDGDGIHLRPREEHRVPKTALLVERRGVQDHEPEGVRGGR